MCMRIKFGLVILIFLFIGIGTTSAEYINFEPNYFEITDYSSQQNTLTIQTTQGELEILAMVNGNSHINIPPQIRKAWNDGFYFGWDIDLPPAWSGFIQLFITSEFPLNNTGCHEILDTGAENISYIEICDLTFTNDGALVFDFDELHDKIQSNISLTKYNDYYYEISFLAQYGDDMDPAVYNGAGTISVTGAGSTGYANSFLYAPFHDTHHFASFPNNEWGQSSTLDFSVGGRESIIKFNISSLYNSNVTGGQIELFLTNNDLDAGESLNLTAYHVYAYPEYNITELTWIEGTGSIGDACTGAEYCYKHYPRNTTQTNPVPLDTITIYDTTPDAYYRWNITSALLSTMAAGNDTITIFINVTVDAGSPSTFDDLNFLSSEVASSSKPRINFTHESRNATCESIYNDLGQNASLFYWNASIRTCWLQQGINIEIEPGATLLLENVTFRFNITANGGSDMIIKDGGSLIISNETNINNSGLNTNKYFIRVEDGATLFMENATVDYAGFRQAIVNRRGLEIYTSNAYVNNITFDKCRVATYFYPDANGSTWTNNKVINTADTNNKWGVYLEGSNGYHTIANNTFIGDPATSLVALWLAGSSYNNITENNFTEYNDDHIILYSQTQIANAPITTNNVIHNNYIDGRGVGYRGIDVGGGSTSTTTITNNEVYNIQRNGSGRDNYGIRVWADGTHIYNNTVKFTGGLLGDQDGYGVYVMPNPDGLSVLDVTNVNIIDNVLTYNGGVTGSTDDGFGVGFSVNGIGNIRNSEIRNNILSDNGRSSNVHTGIGIEMYSGSNNLIINNTIQQNDDYGIFLSGGNNNELHNNTVGSQNYNIFVGDSNDTIMQNDIISASITGIDYGLGVWVYGGNDNLFRYNEYDNNELEVRIENYASGNTFANEQYVDSGGTNYVDFFEGANNNQVIDLFNAGGTLVVGHDVLEEACEFGGNNTILNVSYDTLKICSNNPFWASVPQVTVKWYVQAYVNDTNGDPIQWANVTLYNNTNQLEWNITTNASGLIPVQNVTELIKTNTTTFYFSNYTLNASWNGTLSEEFNLTTNQFIVFEFSFTAILDGIDSVEFAVVISIIISIFTMTFIAVNLDPKYDVLKVLFIGVIIFFLFGAMMIIQIFVAGSSALANVMVGLGNVYLWSGLIFIFMVLVGYIINIIKVVGRG